MTRTLLLADDSVTIQKVVGISFAGEDVTLVTVDNGDDAIARAREVQPDLVLADVVMPGMNGYEVCEAIKADPGLRHVPVLLLTGTFEAFDEERAQQAGAAGHVAKPFEAQTLVDQVMRLLSEPAPAAPERPAASPPPPPPSSSAEDDAFEFFDEDLSASEGQAEPTALLTDELGGPPAPPRGAAEATVALLTDPESSRFGDGPSLETDPVSSWDAEGAEALGDADAGALDWDEPIADASAEAEDWEQPPALDDPEPDDADDADPEELSDFGLSQRDVDDALDFSAIAESPAPARPSAPPPRPVALEPAAPLSPPAAAASSAQVEPALAQALAPEVRRQLHDALEKMAWESLGSMTDEIVRLAVQKVEAAAWEVIPQMAELLIREEIRKMKGDSSD